MVHPLRDMGIKPMYNGRTIRAVSFHSEWCEHRCSSTQAVSANLSKSMQILASASITGLVGLVPCDPAEETTALGLSSLLRVKNSQKALPDLTGFLACIDAFPNTSLLVISNNWGSLLMICDQSLLQGLSIVIRSLDQRLASDIILHVALRWVEDPVV